ncbi:hypothetical protein B0H16DRAFT_1481947 [Mycena metata]|uniref:Uncharacterized protein n=1 Tax=Mycena metata TaxID=1033252 RepID=A0AAD7M966_9AGAR|nr:hypothetical protein B0H16DRAFT_1481947 [Mycena metata]
MLFWIFVFLLASCQTLFDIVWGCLATIFACTWVTLHQNVPDPDLGWFSLLMRKLRMMLMMIIAPELVVGFAARQLVSAGWIAKGKVLYNTVLCRILIYHRIQCLKNARVLLQHGRIYGHPVSRMKQLPAYISGIKKINTADIEDKSKGDTLSKGVAIAQGLWFVTQCLARVSQHLPLTELEVATLAFAVLNVIIRLLWFHKPLNVQQPIVVEEDITLLNNGFRTLLDKLAGAIGGGYDKYSPISSTSVPSFYSIEMGTEDTHWRVNIAGVFGVGSIFGSIHCAAWNALFPSMTEMWIWRTSSGFIAAYPALTTLIGISSEDTDNDTAWAVLAIFWWVGVVVYPLCRLFLTILSFTMLRSLPLSAFVDVNWSNYIPHL